MKGSRMQIGDRQVGDGAPCFVIAEAGVNHNGDIAIAHRLVDAAATAGADAVKFQLFDPALVVSATGRTATYQRSQTGTETQLDLLQTLLLPHGAWIELVEHARERTLTFLCTPFDLPSADQLMRLNVPAFKVPSGELDNLPFIAELAGRGLPLLISTGMGLLDECRNAVSAAAAAPSVGLFHCVTAYPTPSEYANLLAITTMRNALDVPVGWSDHTVGSVTAVAAVTLGAAMLEKHLTLDRTMKGPDHAASAEPEAFAEYVAMVRETEAALGDGQKEPRVVEEENRVLARRSWHTTREVEDGAVITNDDVRLLRPATGLAPGLSPVGRRASRTLLEGMPVSAGDVV